MKKFCHIATKRSCFKNQINPDPYLVPNRYVGLQKALSTFDLNFLSLGADHKLRYAIEVGGWSAKYNYCKF